ncbi:MAG: SurA N-terminal domain-containing protein [Nitrospinae bacterium]|nr:SurA N-terminal domain-containing protein [Nitrospinota bacterium]
MLRFLREKGKSWVLKALLGFVALTFVSFGGFALTDRQVDSGSSRVAAWVGDTPISVHEFEQRYYQRAETLRRQLGEAFNEELARRLGLRRQTLDSLVVEKLQMREAQRLGIEVTNAQVALQVQSLALFQRNGKFDAQQYRSTLESNGITPRQFEENQRRVILLNQLRDYVNLGVMVSEQEVRDAYKWRNAEIKLAAVRLKPEIFSVEVPTLEGDLKAYYEKNKDQFKTGPQRKVSWWHLPFSAVAQVAELSDADLRSHYTRTRAKYERKESVTVNQILLKLPPNANNEKVEAARKRLESLRERVMKGERFTELAKAHSEGPGAKRGGELGVFGRGQMLPELEKVAYALKKGEVSKPVKTSFGMHLLWVRDKVLPGEKPFEEVQKNVEKDLRVLRSRELAKNELRKIRYAVEDKKAEPALAGLKKGETGFFERGRAPQAVPASNVVSELAFGLSGEEKVSREKEGGGGVSFVRLEAKREPFVPQFADVRKQVETSFLRFKGAEVAKGKASVWLQELKDNKRDLSSVAEELKLKVLTPKAFKRADAPDELGPSQELASLAFGLEKGGFGTAHAGSDVILFEVLEGPKTDMKKFESENADFRQGLLRLKKAMVFNQYLERLRQAADIRFEEGFNL